MVADGEDEAMSLALRRAETVGRPVGEAGFL
jgi:putative transposase